MSMNHVCLSFPYIFNGSPSGVGRRTVCAQVAQLAEPEGITETDWLRQTHITGETEQPMATNTQRPRGRLSNIPGENKGWGGKEGGLGLPPGTGQRGQMETDGWSWNTGWLQHGQVCPTDTALRPGD